VPSVWGDVCRAVGPQRPDQFQPLVEAFPEPPWAVVCRAPQLVREPEFAEDGNPLVALGNVAAVGQPREQIQNGRRGGQCLSRLEVCRDGVARYLVEEFLGQDDQVLTVAGQSQLSGILRIPDPGFAHETESGLVDDG